MNVSMLSIFYKNIITFYNKSYVSNLCLHVKNLYHFLKHILKMNTKPDKDVSIHPNYLCDIKFKYVCNIPHDYKRRNCGVLHSLKSNKNF